MKKFFSDFFPVPTFLEMPPAGLAISERAIHLVEFVRTSKGLRLGRHGVRKIPDGAIVEGFINDVVAVGDALRSLHDELSIDFVNASLSEEKAYLFKVKFPKSGITDLRQSVELRLEENVPISANDAFFDFALVPTAPGVDYYDVSVSVLPRKAIDTYVKIIKDAGFKPASITIEAEAISRCAIPKGNMGTFLVVNVGKKSSSLSIVSSGIIQLNISIPIGGSALTTALEKHFSVDRATAHKIKEERGFVKNKENMELFFSLMNTVSAIKDEVNKLFIYWQTRPSSSGVGGGKIEKIILCGKDGGLVGFDEYLSFAVKVPVEVCDVWQNAFSHDDSIPVIPYIDSLDYAAAIGLSLPDDIKSS